MLIHVVQSKIFTEDPAIRFAERYSVDSKIFHELYRRHELTDDDGLLGYFQYKTGKTIHPKAMKRWIFRAKVYARSKDVIKMGVRVINSEYFGDLEEELVKELIKNMRFNGKKDSRTLL